MISFDSWGNSTGNGLSARTVSYAVGSGSDRFLVFMASYPNGGGTLSIGTVTYSGAALTLLSRTDVGPGQTQDVYYLFSPDSGANDLVITPSAGDSLTSVSTDYYFASYSGVADIEVYVINLVASSGTTGTASTTISHAGSWVTGWIVDYVSNDTLTQNTGNLRYQAINANNGKTTAWLDRGPVFPPGNSSVKVDTVVSRGWVGGAFSIKPLTFDSIKARPIYF